MDEIVIEIFLFGKKYDLTTQSMTRAQSFFKPTKITNSKVCSIG